MGHACIEHSTNVLWSSSSSIQHPHVWNLLRGEFKAIGVSWRYPPLGLVCSGLSLLGLHSNGCTPFLEGYGKTLKIAFMSLSSFIRRIGRVSSSRKRSVRCILGLIAKREICHCCVCGCCCVCRCCPELESSYCLFPSTCVVVYAEP